MYESRNKCGFSHFLKESRDGAEVTSTGRLCYMRAPATVKARQPTAGTSRSSHEEDCSPSREGMSAISVNWHRCCGASILRAAVF